MSSACPPWDDRQRLPRCPLCCRGGDSPARLRTCSPYRLPSKWQTPPICHCEAPTGPWQSREGSYVFADDFPVIQLGAARFPRRFAPRNDNRGSIFGRRWCIPTCSCQRRSLSAATDAIGAYRFNGGRYGLHVQRRARLSAPLHRTAEGLRIIHSSIFIFHMPLLFPCRFTDSRHSAACLPGRRAGFPR